MLRGKAMSIRNLIFKSACIKTLTSVEVDTNSSNQHEFNGVKELKMLLGEKRFSGTANFSIRNTNNSCEGDVTWYDAREAHKTRSEYRLYFRANKVMEQAKAGDNIIIGYDQEGRLSFLLIKRTDSDVKSYPSWQKTN